jgi:uncharacterized protein YabE (DUF348 family)
MKSGCFGKRGMCSLFFVLLAFAVFLLMRDDRPVWNDDVMKQAVIIDDGLVYQASFSGAETVGGLLAASGIPASEYDDIFPARDARALPGMMMTVRRAKAVSATVDGGTKEWQTLAGTVEDAIADAGIALDEDDIVKPARGETVHAGTKISIVRVEVREESVEKAVAFDKKANEDDKLSWRKTIVTQKGEKGIDRLTYRVSSHDGKEVNRKLIKTERIKEPVTEITTQGTYVKTGKSHTGAASWYAWTGTMAAANPWLPMGSYVRVTNVDNGKSVIVKINDRGPFVPGRIIDLDKVAFQKIASIGAGVINVKMEEITN